MDRKTALQALGLDENASDQHIQATLAAKKQDIASKKANAPTEALQAKFEALEARLAEAEAALSPRRSQPAGDSPDMDKTPSPASSLPQAHSQRQSAGTPLSQTKLADLPGMAPQDAAQVELQPGQILANRYEIKELIGQGGMGAVYRAFDKNRDEDIAIKLLLPSLTKNERALERFLNEARISSKLSNQHIINVYDVQNDGELYFLIMELLEGQDLAQLILTREQLNQPFTAKELTELMEQLAPALDYAHQHTVHRDIKPENIWLDEDGHYKLMDFGIAQLQSTSQRTQTGAAMGTAYYMAPEQLKGSKHIDARADIYALGVMLYAMATGDVPAGLIKPLHEKRPDISPAFSNAVMQCLEADPQDRPQTAGALLLLLQQGVNLKGGKAGRKTKAPTVTNSSAVQLSAGPNKWAIAAVLLLVIGIGGTMATGVIDFSGLMPMSAEAKAEKEAAIARIQGEIKVLKQRLETGKRNLDSDLREAERNKSNKLDMLEYWQRITDNAIFKGSQIGELEGVLSMAESLLRKEQYEKSESAFYEVKRGYKKLNEEFLAGEKIWAADRGAKKAESEWIELKKKYEFSGESQEAKDGRKKYKEANEKVRGGDFVESLSLYEGSVQYWRDAVKSDEVIAWVDKVEGEWSKERERKRRRALEINKKKEKINAVVNDLQSEVGSVSANGRSVRPDGGAGNYKYIAKSRIKIDPSYRSERGRELCNLKMDVDFEINRYWLEMEFRDWPLEPRKEWVHSKKGALNGSYIYRYMKGQKVFIAKALDGFQNLDGKDGVTKIKGVYVSVEPNGLTYKQEGGHVAESPSIPFLASSNEHLNKIADLVDSYINHCSDLATL